MRGSVHRSVITAAACLSVAAAMAQFDVQVNVGADGRDIPGDAANEPMLVVDPHDPNMMAVGWRNFSDRMLSEREAGYAFTRDGGWTWTYPGTIEHFPSGYRPSMVSDPVLAALPDGNLLYASLVWSSWSSQQAVFVSCSTDHGASWRRPTFVLEVDGAEVLDKEWITVARGNVVYITYTLGTDAPWYIYIQRSNDGGRTFTPRFLVTEDRGEHASMPAVGPDGTIYLATLHTEQPGACVCVRVAVDTDGLAWPPRFGEPTRFRRAAVWGGQGTCVTGLHVPAIAVDRGDGPFRGSAYVAYVRRSRMEAQDVAVARTHDRGATWDITRRVNDASVFRQRDCFIPAIGVAPDGRVDVVWYDRRNDPDCELAAMYYSYSIDGGASWQPNARLTEPFDPTLGYPDASHKIGEYIGIVSLRDELRLVYTATFGGEQNLYCLVHRPYLGDLNGDRVVDRDDLEPFVLAACDPGAYAGAYPTIDARRRGDLNHDGRVDITDVEYFIEQRLAK